MGRKWAGMRPRMAAQSGLFEPGLGILLASFEKKNIPTAFKYHPFTIRGEFTYMRYFAQVIFTMFATGFTHNV